MRELAGGVQIQAKFEPLPYCDITCRGGDHHALPRFGRGALDVFQVHGDDELALFYFGCDVLVRKHFVLLSLCGPLGPLMPAQSEDVSRVRGSGIS